MDNSTEPHQGRILELLIIRSGKKKKDAAKDMGFHPSHISSVFKEPILSEEINAAELPENEQNRDRILEGACRIGGELLELNRLCPEEE